MSGPHSLPFGIRGVGVALPAQVRTNDFWSDKLEARTEEQRRGDVLVVEHGAEGQPTKLPDSIKTAMVGFDDLYRGAVHRRVLDEDAELSDLEVEAVKNALFDAAVDPGDVDLLLVHSLPADLAIPLNAAAVQAKAGLRRALAWNIEVGCGSFQAQLLAATGMLASGLFKQAVIVQSAAMSRIMDFHSPMSVGFGDGAVAAVVSRLEEGYGLLGSASATDGTLRDAVVLGPKPAPGRNPRWWKGDGASVLHPLDTHVGKAVGLAGPEMCRDTCMAALDDARLALSDVDWFICTQSVGWFVDACRRELGLPKEKTIDTFRDIANIGAGALLYNIAELRKRGALRDGQNVLLYAPSAGFTRSAVVIKWRETRPARPS